MSFFYDLVELGNVLKHACINFDDTLTSRFFVAFDFWPIIVGAVGVGVFVAHKEVFYTLLITGWTLNALINWGLREAIDQIGPESLCFSAKQMPAYAGDGIAFLGASFLVASSYIYSVPLRFFTIVMLSVGGPLALYTRLWLHANTPAQMFAGAGFGLAEALIFLFILKYVFTYDRINRWFLMSNTWLVGANYQDTLIQPWRMVLTAYMPTQELYVKINSTEGFQRARMFERLGPASERARRINETRRRRLDVNNRLTDNIFNLITGSDNAEIPTAIKTTPTFILGVK